MRPWICCVLLFGTLLLQGQQEEPRPGSVLFREDQFYLGVSYNLLLDTPRGLTQNNLSYGLQGGFIRDFPLNQASTVALGVGLGYGVNSYYSNLRALQDGEDYQYILLDSNTDYRRNKIETHLIELPLELRWRNATPDSYKFWRIYGGVKLGYVVGSRSKYVTDSFTDSFYNTDTRNLRYGLMLNVGYNTFNLHLYYGLNRLFEEGTPGPDNQPLEMRPLHLGLIFYIL